MDRRAVSTIPLAVEYTEKGKRVRVAQTTIEAVGKSGATVETLRLSRARMAAHDGGRSTRGTQVKPVQ